MNSSCINEYISTAFVIEPRYPFLVFILACLLFLSSHLLISSIGCSRFKNLGMARGARLPVAVGRGVVSLVGSKNRVT